MTPAAGGDPAREEGLLDLTVAIPTRNGASSYLDDLLDALDGQQVPPGRSWEVLAVDNGSTDGTSALLAARDGRIGSGVPLRVVAEPERGCGHARQRAVVSARGRRVAFLDDDNLPDPGWIAEAIAFEEGAAEVGAVTGRIAARFERPPPPGFERIESFFAIFDRGESPRPLDTAAFELPPGAGLVVDRRAWLAHVPARLRHASCAGNDLEACLHLALGGLEIRYDPALRLTHRIAARRLEPESLDALLREAGGCLCSLRLIGRRGLDRPRVAAEVGGGSALRLAARLLRSVPSRNRGVVARAEAFFHLHAALSPLRLRRVVAPGASVYDR